MHQGWVGVGVEKGGLGDEGGIGGGGDLPQPLTPLLRSPLSVAACAGTDSSAGCPRPGPRALNTAVHPSVRPVPALKTTTFHRISIQTIPHTNPSVSTSYLPNNNLPLRNALANYICRYTRLIFQVR